MNHNKLFSVIILFTVALIMVTLYVSGNLQPVTDFFTGADEVRAAEEQVQFWTEQAAYAAEHAGLPPIR